MNVQQFGIGKKWKKASFFLTVFYKYFNFKIIKNWLIGK